jgi:translation factor SUA5
MHEFCQKLIQKLGKPIVSTSANISGQPSPKKIGEISDEIKNGVDFIVPEIYDKPLYDKPSSIIAIGEGNLIKSSGSKIKKVKIRVKESSPFSPKV